MNEYQALMIARAEHEQRNRSLAPVPDYPAANNIDQPGWVSRQAGRLLCTIGAGLSSLGKRLKREQTILIEAPSTLEAQ